MTASKRSVSTNRIMRSIGPPATPTCWIIPSRLRLISTSTGPPGAIMCSKKGLVLGIVQVHELETVQPEQPQGPFDRAPHLITGEVASLRVAVGLGGQHAVLGQPSDLREHLTYAPLALPITVGGGRVEEVQRALEDGV